MNTECEEVYKIERLYSRTRLPPRDADEIRTLLAELSPGRKLPKEHEIELVLFGTVSIFVARVRESQKIVSMATLATHPRSLWGSQTAGIWDVVTLQEHRRRGLAESILGKIISSARSANLLYLELFSRPQRAGAHELYKKLGFIPISEARGDKGRHCYRLYLQQS